MSVVFPTSELKPLIATIAGRFILVSTTHKVLGLKLNKGKFVRAVKLRKTFKLKQ